MSVVAYGVIILAGLLIYEAWKGLNTPAVAAAGGGGNVSPAFGPQAAAPPGAGSGQLSLEQLTAYAKAAGFRGQALQTVVALAYRENSGRAQGYNPIPVYAGGVENHAYGVLQFLSPMWGSSSQLQDPAYSFQLAYKTWQQQGFAPWVCDVECGFAPGQGIVPSSPQTVFGPNGQPIALPPGFYQVVQ